MTDKKKQSASKRIEVYPERGVNSVPTGAWRWRRRHGNKIVAESDIGYETQKAAEDQANIEAEINPAEVVVVEDDS